MRYKLAIFDLDGTLLDTLEDLADSTNYAMRMMHFEEHTIDEVRHFVGNGIRKLIERAVPEHTEEEDINRAFALFKDYYKEHCADKTKPYNGIMELLEHLQKNGCRLAVVSNKADFAVKELCKQYFGNRFDLAIGEREGIMRKPSPDSVNEVLKELGIKRQESVYIGDSEVDIQTAENAKMDCIIVDWGFRERDFLISMGASNVVSAPKTIEKIILEN